MAFEEIKENAEELKNHAKELYESNLRYYKLLIFKKVVQSTTAAIKGIIVAVLSLFVIIFLSIALALGLGYWLDNFAYGFLIVGLIYIILAIIVYYTADKMVEGSMLARFSKSFFSNDKRN